MWRSFSYALPLVHRVAQIGRPDRPAVWRPCLLSQVSARTERWAASPARSIISGGAPLTQPPIEEMSPPPGQHGSTQIFLKPDGPSSAWREALTAREPSERRRPEPPAHAATVVSEKGAPGRLKPTAAAPSTLIAARLRERLSPLEPRIPPPVLSAIHDIQRESLLLAGRLASASRERLL